MFKDYLDSRGRIKSSQPIQVRQDWFIFNAKKEHGDKYNYSLVKYVSQKDKVQIICKIHGIFEQTPKNHLKGNSGVQGCGCPTCQGNTVKTTQQLKIELYKIYGLTLGLSKVEYKNAATPVLVECLEHNTEFQARPTDLLSRSTKCPLCHTRYPNKIYILKCNITGLTKIGITSSINKRILNIGGDLRLISIWDVPKARVLEKQLHEKYKQYNVFNPQVKNGFTEFFSLTDKQIQNIVQEIDQYVRSL